MKIDVYSNMRNEIRLLPYFLRHYESFANRIFVWEDQSDDGTREMLEAHPKVTVLDPGFHGANDELYIKKLWPQYRDISRGHADWCMCVDADEFVYHPDLVNKLGECLAQNKKRLRLSGFTMYTDAFPTTNGQIYDEIKYGWPDRWSKKTVVFTPDVHMIWTVGRHQCMHNSVHPTQKDTGISLLHFRYLGAEYFLSRHLKNFANMGVEYNPKKHFNLPDGSRGISTAWYEDNKHKVIRVVE